MTKGSTETNASSKSSSSTDYPLPQPPKLLPFFLLCHNRFFFLNINFLAPCFRLAIVHDIAEALAGDIAPSDGIPKEEKHRLEVNALTTMCNAIGHDEAVAEEIKELWNEYEDGETNEAKLLKDIDKLEMILQALEYEEREKHLDLSEFFTSVQGKMKTGTGEQWAQEIVRRRRAKKE